ncbi:DUF6894 family protein [Methylobacterium planeticum]|uniref:DUF6894 domain-containing protein n=1 Tax=Methylobacterium planeticum TaxID=2615211 RepID=A0A6N6MRJ9_9HYPH|nr:hypothetical protein [Methylobacterium planeticum]KAB1071210.1 hypothetical protein F6X51_20185 [Methylobacterium planeticum]
MPRYFFHVHDGVSLLDHEGTELADWHQAQFHAIRTAGEIISDNAKRLKLGEDWKMEVTDEVGLVLFRLDFHVASSAAVMGEDWKQSAAEEAARLSPNPPT